jgi:hypothetical protein
MPELKLYVWTDFCPNWTEGLAFAIAETVGEAKQLVEAEHGLIVGVDGCVQDWGTLTIRDLDQKRAWCVEGGGYV